MPFTVRRGAAGATVALLASAALGFTAPATAEAGTTVRPVPTAAGYVSRPAGGVTSVSTAFTVPAVDCAGHNGAVTMGLFVGSDPARGFDLYGGPDTDMYAGVRVICHHDRDAEYWIAVGNHSGAIGSSGVGPGTRIELRLYRKDDRTILAIHFGTRWFTTSSVVSAAALLGTSPDLTAVNSTMPSFHVAFDKARVDGSPMGRTAPEKVVSRWRHTVVADPSRLSRHEGAFTLDATRPTPA